LLLIVAISNTASDLEVMFYISQGRDTDNLLVAV